MFHSQKLFRRLSKQFSTPSLVQQLLRSFEYNSRKPETMRSALLTYENKAAHCLEATFLAAAILEHRKIPTLIMSMESKDNIGHVVFIFRENKKWGAIGKSREVGLQGRAPVFRSVRALAWSYVDPYVDDTGEMTSFATTDLGLCPGNWRDSAYNLWQTEKYILNLKHKPLRASRARHNASLSIYNSSGHKTQPFWW